MSDAIHERIHFRLIDMPCCHMIYCHVNPRLPNYCPECGARCYAQIKSGAYTVEEWQGWLSKAGPVVGKEVPEDAT